RQMTRFCMRCDRIIGEKCFQCGTEAIADSNGHAVTWADFGCPSCGYHFPRGDGGETEASRHGVHNPELQKEYVDAAKSQRRWSELARAKSRRRRLQRVRSMPRLQQVTPPDTKICSYESTYRLLPQRESLGRRCSKSSINVATCWITRTICWSLSF